MILHYLAAEIQDTQALADSLAPHLGKGDIILLNGPLGSGKTSFVQALARAFGYAHAVTSPTFTIANFYETPQLTLLHIDAYRLETLAEFRDTALSDYMDDCCSLVEWGEKVADALDDPLPINISFTDGSETERHFVLASENERWTPVLQHIKRGHLRVVAE